MNDKGSNIQRLALREARAILREAEQEFQSDPGAAMLMDIQVRHVAKALESLRGEYAEYMSELVELKERVRLSRDAVTRILGRRCPV